MTKLPDKDLKKLLKEKSDHEISHTDKLKKAYCAAGLTFDTYYSGSITKVIFADGKTKKHGSLTLKPGMFIPKITNRVVAKRIQDGLYVPKNTNPNRHTNNTIMYSSERIRENLFKPCFAVDISGCYWQTAFNLGIIDEETYLKGIAKDREYKDARNIAIGSIGSLTIHERYEQGKLVLHELIRKPTACARLDIIDHVWEMAQRVAGKLGKDFLMYLTDCFFVPEDRLNDVCAYLEAEGYKTKAERCEFGSVQRMHEGTSKSNKPFYTEKVIWYLPAKDKFKFHDFSNIHDKTF